MKWIMDIDNNLCEMEIYECACGFHIGLDFSYLDRIAPISLNCPNCNKILNTQTVIYPEWKEKPA